MPGCRVLQKSRTKESDSGASRPDGLVATPGLRVFTEISAMAETCAACDYPLDGNRISVKLGGKTVEVCCEECAQKLKEAHPAGSA